MVIWDKRSGENIKTKSLNSPSIECLRKTKMDVPSTSMDDEGLIALARDASVDYARLAAIPDGPLERVKDAEQITKSLLVRMDEVCKRKECSGLALLFDTISMFVCFFVFFLWFEQLLGVAGSLEKDAQVCKALDAAVAPQLEQLKAVYRLIDLCAKHVAEVDAAVTAMENAGKAVIIWSPSCCFKLLFSFK